MNAHFILYVADQMKSTEFYSAVLDRLPSLDVPGMTEFALADNAVLGLMPNSGVSRLLNIEVGNSTTTGSRCEVYLVVDEPADYHKRALTAGACELSPLTRRDWGHSAAYSLDPDGHVIAFARSI